jgi:glutamate formiminotransferase
MSPLKIEKIVNFFQGKEGIKLLNYQRDDDQNRMVVMMVYHRV